MSSSLGIRTLGAALVVGLTLLLMGASSAWAASPGVVQVEGSTVKPTVLVDLERDLGASKSVQVDGVKAWPLRQIILFVQGKQPGNVDINSLSGPVTVVPPGTKMNPISVSPAKVADKGFDKKLPLFYIDDESGETSLYYNGRKGAYTGMATATVALPSSKPKLNVKLSRSGSGKLKVGDSEVFEAKVTNAGSAKVTLSWTVNGARKQGGGAATYGKLDFEFPKDGSYQVTVFAKADGMEDGFATLSVTVGKAPKKDPEKEKQQPTGPEPGNTPIEPYDPGYADPYGVPPTGTIDPSPVTPSSPRPKPDKPKQDEPAPPVDVGETVTGQVIDPAVIGTVVPSSELPATETEQAEPADDGSDQGGVAIPKGVSAALGIGALLGLGGLAEAGAFAGLRRFRFRL